MSPVEKIRQVTDTTRVSLPIATMLTLLGLATGAVAAGYAAKDQLISKVTTDREVALVAERQRGDQLYMTKTEFWQTIYPRLVRIEAKLDQTLKR